VRWTWIDDFTHFESRKTATAVKNLSFAEDHFADHFPGYPVMPAPLMLEGLAQTGGILVGEANGYAENVILGKITKAKFYREAMPGETLVYKTDLMSITDAGANVQGTITSGGELVGEAEIFFAHVDKELSRQVTGDANFVFSGELKTLVNRAKAK
jgi:3-hydroxyacyl-[acyl-carrier-protein] dehydratase